MKVAFDTEALLAFYLAESGSQKVLQYLEQVHQGEVEGVVNIVSLVELYYILHRKGRVVADEKVANLLSYGIRIVGIPYDTLWREAAKIKATHAISLADAFVAATAKLEKAILLTGADQEFGGLGVQIVRIR